MLRTPDQPNHLSDRPGRIQAEPLRLPPRRAELHALHGLEPQTDRRLRRRLRVDDALVPGPDSWALGRERRLGAAARDSAGWNRHRRSGLRHRSARPRSLHRSRGEERGVQRRADRPRQPQLPPSQPRARPQRRRTRPAARRRALRRPGPVQGRQRQPRPHGRRRRADRAHNEATPVRSSHRHPRALRRRRVRHTHG